MPLYPTRLETRGGVGGVSNPNQELSRGKMEKVSEDASGIGTKTKTLFKTVCME